MCVDRSRTELSVSAHVTTRHTRHCRLSSSEHTKHVQKCVSMRISRCMRARETQRDRNAKTQSKRDHSATPQSCPAHSGLATRKATHTTHTMFFVVCWCVCWCVCVCVAFRVRAYAVAAGKALLQFRAFAGLSGLARRNAVNGELQIVIHTLHMYTQIVRDKQYSRTGSLAHIPSH